MKEKIQILLVEDTPSDVRLTEEALKLSQLQYHLNVVSDGVEAMEYLQRQKSCGELPDIVLLDLNMPRKNGHEVLEEITNDAALKAIPVILLTVSERDEDVLEALRLKMNYYIAKPVRSEHLSALINSIHQLHQQHPEQFSDSSPEEKHIRMVLAGNPHTSVLAMAKLTDDEDTRVRCRAAENPCLSVDLQMKMAIDCEPEVRVALCENANVFDSVLEILAKDTSEDVRLAVSDSKHVSERLLRLLSTDVNVYVSASANKTLAGQR